MNNQNEFRELQKIGKRANYKNGINSMISKHTVKVFKRYIPNNTSSILELGPAEGVMTDSLANLYKDYTIVEAVTQFCENIKNKYEHISINNCLFEEFDTDKKYDVIILGHVLEHVENPIDILALVKKWVSPNGLILTAVPNSNSIHRQAAVKMGILKVQDELGETDKLIGHRRVYNLEKLKEDFKKAGIDIHDEGGYFLKPLTNNQMENQFTDCMINAFMELGEKYPDIAAEIYLIGKNN